MLDEVLPEGGSAEVVVVVLGLVVRGRLLDLAMGRHGDGRAGSRRGMGRGGLGVVLRRRGVGLEAMPLGMA